MVEVFLTDVNSIMILGVGKKISIEGGYSLHQTFELSEYLSILQFPTYSTAATAPFGMRIVGYPKAASNKFRCEVDC